MREQLIDTVTGALYCDWRVNVANCEHGDEFAKVWAVSSISGVLSAIVAGLCLYDRLAIKKLKLYHNGTLRGNETLLFLTALATVFQSIQGLLILFVPSADLYARETMFALMIFIAMVGEALYIHAILCSLPQKYLDHAQQVKQIWVPPQIAQRWFIAVALTSAITQLLTGLLLAVKYGQEGDWTLETILFRYGMLVFTCHGIILLIGLSYGAWKYFTVMKINVKALQSVHHETKSQRKRIEGELAKTNRLVMFNLFGVANLNILFILMSAVPPLYSIFPLSIIVQIATIIPLPWLIISQVCLDYLIDYRAAKAVRSDSSDPSDSMHRRATPGTPASSASNKPPPLAAKNEEVTSTVAIEIGVNVRPDSGQIDIAFEGIDAAAKGV